MWLNIRVQGIFVGFLIDFREGCVKQTITNNYQQQKHKNSNHKTNKVEILDLLSSLLFVLQKLTAFDISFIIY
jgi:hypothetical protein